LAKRVKWPNNERSEALGSIAHHRSYGSTAFTGRQPIRAMAFPSALALLTSWFAVVLRPRPPTQSP
jgi:hypothetical protein